MRGFYNAVTAAVIVSWTLGACANPSFSGAGRMAPGGQTGKQERQDTTKTSNNDDGKAATVIAVGDTAKVQDIPGAGPTGRSPIGTGSASNGPAGSGHGDDKGKIKSVKSEDPEIATVSSDGTITGKKPGETTVEVVYDDGSTAKIKVTVTPPGEGDGTAGNDAPGGSDGDATPASVNDSGDVSKRGCKIEGDKITWNWPKEIQACFDAKRIWDFTRKICTDMHLATSYECSFAGIDGAVQGISANFTPDWDKGRLKLIACGERDVTAGLGRKTHTVAWQYIMLPEKGLNGDCNFSFNAGIAIGCFEATSFSLQSSSASDVQRCLDGK